MRMTTEEAFVKTLCSATIWMGMRRLVIAVGRGNGLLLAKEEAQCPVAMQMITRRGST